MGKTFFCWFARKIAGILAFIFADYLSYFTNINSIEMDRAAYASNQIGREEGGIKKLQKKGGDIKKIAKRRR